MDSANWGLLEDRMDLNGFVGDPRSHPAEKQLTDGSVHRKTHAGVLLPRSFSCKQAHSIDFGG